MESERRHAGRPRRFGAVFVSTLLFAGVLAAIAAPALAADPTNVSAGLVICKGDTSSANYIVNPHGSSDTPFICSETTQGAGYADYSGNAGKGWNELDLVPFRLDLDAGTSAPASQTYTFAVALDGKDVGRPGYDIVTKPTLNDNLSSSTGCSLGTISAQLTKAPGFGGTDETIYRLVTMTQSRGAKCVLDFDGRLAVGSHLYPGASLHGNYANEALTQTGQDRSIPVNEIQPQEISKDMTATRGSDHAWNITKGATPLELDLGETCAATNGDVSGAVTVKVEWEKLAATPSGDVTIITNIYATNPAHRSVIVNVTDRVYEGTTQTTLVDDENSGDVTVAAGETDLILTHTVTTSSASTTFNDVATATYKDALFPDVPIPGTTEATASATVQNTGPVTNASAVITDSESITGTGLTFSVDSTSAGSASGNLTTVAPFGQAGAVAYTLGTPTTGPVYWVSASQTGNGSVEFNKTVYFDGPGVASGALSDTASLAANNGGTAGPVGASTTITSSVAVDLTLSKTITSNVLQGTETATFSFAVKDSNGVAIQGSPFSIQFGASDPINVAKTTSIDDLPADEYTVTETAPSGWSAGGSIDVDLTPPPLSQCSGTATFTNSFVDTASARVKKVTDPAGHESGWEFELYQDNAPAGAGSEDTLLDTKTTSGTGFVSFSTQLGEGSYYILETEQSGWTNEGGSPQCAFSVDLPANANDEFSCTFTNTSRGEAKVIKTVSGGAPTGSQSFTFQLRQGASTTSEGTTLETVAANAGNGGQITFTTQLIPGQHYQLCEAVLPGWNTSLNGGLFVPGSMLTPILPNPDVNNVWVCTDFIAKFNDTTTFTVDNTPPPGGRALTIGFWKNWASCSKSAGKQANTLDTILGSFPGGGVNIGTLFVNTCQEAVRILSKQEVTTGKNKASDPAYNLAAQLLAARLNVQAGAGICPAAQTAIDQGQGILDGPPPANAVTFTGAGTYAKKGTFATDANNLANVLDRYNNNNLC